MANKRSITEGLDGSNSNKRQDAKTSPTPQTVSATAILQILKSLKETTLTSIRLDAAQEYLNRCKQDLHKTAQLDSQFRSTEKAKYQSANSQVNYLSQNLNECRVKDDQLVTELCSALAEDLRAQSSDTELDWIKEQLSLLQNNASQETSRVKSEISELAKGFIEAKKNKEDHITSLFQSTVSQVTRAESKKDTDELVAEQIVEVEAKCKQDMEYALQSVEDRLRREFQQQIDDAKSSVMAQLKGQQPTNTFSTAQSKEIKDKIDLEMEVKLQPLQKRIDSYNSIAEGIEKHCKDEKLEENFSRLQSAFENIKRLFEALDEEQELCKLGLVDIQTNLSKLDKRCSATKTKVEKIEDPTLRINNRLDALEEIGRHLQERYDNLPLASVFSDEVFRS